MLVRRGGEGKRVCLFISFIDFFLFISFRGDGSSFTLLGKV